MGLYPKIKYDAGKHSCVLQPNRLGDTPVKVRPDLPGNIIVIHGVNDVGEGYDAVEKGLCAGLNKRLSLKLEPAFIACRWQPAPVSAWCRARNPRAAESICAAAGSGRRKLFTSRTHSQDYYAQRYSFE
jgi:hypothetical protein